jgi:hypothetical protein
MTPKFEKDDSGIRIHGRGVIAQLCSLFRSHEHGLPEWFKNASTAYARDNVPTEHRVLTLLFGQQRADGRRYIVLLDHVGMTVEDVEQRFAHWGDPDAHLGEGAAEEVLEGGHGNGGKCYMTQMFEHLSFLHTVKKGRGCRYGFVGDDPHPGYFPDKKSARGFPVSTATGELQRVLGEFGVEFRHLPEEVRTAAAARDGFTIVAGISPKHLEGNEAERKLVDDILGHPQMQITVQKTRIYVLVNGRPVKDYAPITLPPIDPHDYAPEPKLIPIPDELVDPRSGQKCRTREAKGPQGQLVLRTSKVSMKWSLKSRHHITYLSRQRPVAFLRMENVSRSIWVDKMYGDCRLDSLAEYETPDRSILADAPLTRAIENWIRERILEYEAEFKKRDRLEASQEQKNKIQELNQVLDRWKNKFLDDTAFGAGTGSGEGVRQKTRRRPLPTTQPTSVHLKCPYGKAGVGVWIRATVEFHDLNGNKVAPPAFNWHSSDWAVATVDGGEGVVTHMPGRTEIWVETIDGKLRSPAVQVEVLDTRSIRIEPAELQIAAGKIQPLAAIVTARDGSEHRDVFMTWLPDDSSIATVTSTGKVIARKPGKTMIYAADERCIEAKGGCAVTVTAAEVSPGTQGGKAYPQILLSEISPDPLNPDGETVRLSPEDGPVHQPTPQHVEHNVWWINLQCPLARMYFDSPYGPDSREWRAYHIERYIEALVKIRLGLDFQVAEEELTFDEVERRWREVASEVQRRALEDLRGLLECDDQDD